MENSLAALGIVVLTSKTIYRIAGLGYILVSVGCIIASYCLDKETRYGIEAGEMNCKGYENKMWGLCQWVLFTNIVALSSAIAFFHCNKGTTISVVGMFVWLFNILNMLVLFTYAQFVIFNSDISDCRDAAATFKVNVGFVRQYDANLSYVIFQYIKLGIVFVAYLFYKFCMRGK